MLHATRCSRHTARPRAHLLTVSGHMTQALGSYAGVVTRASGMHVQVLFDEDQQRYWFPADRVQHWLVSLDAGDDLQPRPSKTRTRRCSTALQPHSLYSPPLGSRGVAAGVLCSHRSLPRPRVHTLGSSRHSAQRQSCRRRRRPPSPARRGRGGRRQQGGRAATAVAATGWRRVAMARRRTATAAAMAMATATATATASSLLRSSPRAMSCCCMGLRRASERVRERCLRAHIEGAGSTSVDDPPFTPSFVPQSMQPHNHALYSPGGARKDAAAASAPSAKFFDQHPDASRSCIMGARSRL